MNILIAEDDATLRDMVEERIRIHYPKANCYTVGDGKKGLELSYSVKFDVVITDYNMPKMNGLQMARHIRNEHGLIPMVLISATPEDVERGQDNPFCYVSYKMDFMSNAGVEVKRQLDKLVGGMKKEK